MQGMTLLLHVPVASDIKVPPPKTLGMSERQEQLARQMVLQMEAAGPYGLISGAKGRKSRYPTKSVAIVVGVADGGVGQLRWHWPTAWR